MAMTRPDLSLILACYNEAEHIEYSVPQILRILDASRWNYEVIFVDDVSRDNTRELIQKLIAQFPHHTLSFLFHETNTGRGGAVRDGFQAAQGSIVGFIDIDLEISPSYIFPCVIEVQSGADIAIAERIYRLQPRFFYRHLLSRAYSWLVRRILKLPFMDTEAGFKFFRREAALELLRVTYDQGWFWDTEILANAHYRGFKVVEVPCLFHRNPSKTSTVRPVRDSIQYFRKLTTFWRQQIKAHHAAEVQV